MNYLVDVVVIGDSIEGYEVIKKIAPANPSIKMAFISREFKSTTTYDFLNVEYLKGEVIFTSYKNRLFGCFLENGDRVYCTHLIIATGLAYAPLVLNNEVVPCVYNSLTNIPKTAKSQPAIVLGQQNSDVKFALDVAKKYKQVYFCTDKPAIEDITAANEKKLSEAENIVVLPNTSPLNVVVSEGILQEVELDNYSTITCSAIYVKTDTSPEVNFVSDKLIKKTTTNYLEVSDIAESALVPKCYAIGSCAKKSTKKMQQAMVDAILKDF